MKISKPFLLMALVIATMSLISRQLLAQTCVSCDTNQSNVTVGYNNNVNSSWTRQSILGNNNTTSRNNAVAIGTNSTASWSHSYVFGSSSSSNGIHSYAIGSNSIAQSTSSYAIGNHAKSMFGNAFSVGNFTRSDAVGAYVFGLGVSSAIPLINNVGNSLAIGFISTKPTLFVSESEYSANYDLTGKVGIGNVTAPQAKLHIRGDAQEDATLLLEPSDYRRRAAALYMLDRSTELYATYEEGLRIYTELENGISFYARTFKFLEGRVGINNENPEYELDVGGDARVSGGILANALLINNTPTITNGRIGRFAYGSASAPAYSFSGNTNTGMFRPANANALAFSTEGFERVRISNNGYVGIGSQNPTEMLTIDNSFGKPINIHIGQNQYIYNNAHWSSSDQKTKRVKSGTAYGIRFSNDFLAFDVAGTGTQGSIIQWNRAMIIDTQGNIGMGTVSPQKMLHVAGQSRFDGDMLVTSANIYVDGEVHAKKFRATLDIPWPDYVFDPSYNLLQLQEVEQFINTNRHLPGIPSAQTVEQEGFELAEMNALLLKKIEELTLYVIEQQKALSGQQKELNTLKEKMSQIENQ